MVVSISSISDEATPQKARENIPIKNRVCIKIDCGDPIQAVSFFENSSNFLSMNNGFKTFIILRLYDIIYIMETQSKNTAKDVFVNLGAIVALYAVVVSLISLLFTVINTAYPQITNGYGYMGSSSISWPVATLIIFFPVFIFLMWLLEKDFIVNPEKQTSGIHKWLSYFTLFIAGLVLAVDLITVLYFFIDGQELSTAFLLKVFVLLVIATGIFTYYLYDVLNKLTSKGRKVYRVIALVIILASIIWGFAVLGSPRTQRLFKYDEQKMNDLVNIKNEITNYYAEKGVLPETLDVLKTGNYYIQEIDTQTNTPYEYKKTSDLAYSLCAVFNKASKDTKEMITHNYGSLSWTHEVGHTCFDQTVNSNLYAKPVPVR